MLKQRCRDIVMPSNTTRQQDKVAGIFTSIYTFAIKSKRFGQNIFFTNSATLVQIRSLYEIKSMFSPYRYWD